MNPRLQKVGDRDGWVCGICHETVSSAAKPATGWRSPTLDHIKPKAKGGTDGLANLQVAHYGCNQEKGDGTTKSPPRTPRSRVAQELREKWLGIRERRAAILVKIQQGG